MQRRQLLKLMGATAALSYLPRALAADTALTLYGPPVMPTLLLGAAAAQGSLKNSRKLTVKAWSNVDMLRAGLANRSIDVSIVPSYVAANLAARGQGVKLVNIMTFGLLQIIGRDQAISGIADLAGKKLVMPFKNDMPDLVLQALCRRQNIPFSRLQVQYTATPPEALMTFMQKRADFALLPEPMVSMAIMRGQQMQQQVVRALDIQKVWEQTMGVSGGIPQAGLMVSRAFYEQQGPLVGQLQQDIQQALTWTRAHPTQAAAIGARYLPAPAAAIQQALPHSRLAAAPAAGIAQDILLFFKELHGINPQIVGGKMADASLFAAL